MMEKAMRSKNLSRLVCYLIPNIGTIVIVAFMLLTYTTWAAPSAQDSLPGVISYQGTLTDDAGQPITGEVGITFRLYAAPTGGTALWTEAHTGANAVPTESGLFHVLLGSLTPIPSTVWANDQLYLGIRVGSDPEMEPREMLGAVPYAMEAFSVRDRAVKSRHAQLTTGRVAASDTIYLTESSQTIPGTTFTLTPETDQTYLIYATVDFELSDSLATASLIVDSVPQPASIIFRASGGWERSTVSQSYLIDLEGGMPHTLALQSQQISGSGGTVWRKHTTVTYLAVSQ
jgi:hypothetical protein